MTTFTREDYEMAAKAGAPAAPAHTQGWRYSASGPRGEGMYAAADRAQHWFWNPLADDGDALRLANRLRICVEFGYCEDDAPVIWVGLIEDRRNWPRYEHFPDPNAATRRAIFCAAIEIGRKLRAQNPQPSV